MLSELSGQGRQDRDQGPGQRSGWLGVGVGAALRWGRLRPRPGNGQASQRGMGWGLLSLSFLTYNVELEQISGFLMVQVLEGWQGGRFTV